MKKKIITLLAFSTLLLTGCQFINPFGFLSNFGGDTGDNPSGGQNNGGNYSIDTNDHGTNVIGKDDYTPTKTDILYTYKDLANHSVYPTDSIPTHGNVKILVIPVWFTDSTKAIDETSGSLFSTKKSKAEVREDIANAFFDRTENASWMSVKRYYEAASFGKLNIDGAVTGWYNCGQSALQISNNELTVQLVESAVAWAKTNYGKSSSNPSGIDFTEYDSDKNGYLDSVCLIYGYHNSNYKEGFGGFTRPTRGNDNLWAYAYWTQNTKTKNVNNPGANAFLWASYDFMYKEYAGGANTEDNKVDAHTYIHELGHCMGLEDYYDYNTQNGSCRSGGFSMQDFNVGGHDPYSRMALGWTRPYVPTNDCTITLKPYDTYGDCIVLSPNFSGSPFDEYILIEYYNAGGLNQFDSTNQWSNGYPTGSSTSGIRIWHVDSRLLEYREYPRSLDSGYQIGGKTMNDRYYYILGVLNTTYASAYADYCSVSPQLRDYSLLHLIRNSKTISYRPGDKAYFKSDDLFREGDSFSLEEYSSQFINTDRLNNGQRLPIRITVSSMTANEAVISVKAL